MSRILKRFLGVRKNAFEFEHPVAHMGPQFLTTGILIEPLAVQERAIRCPDGQGLSGNADEQALQQLSSASPAIFPLLAGANRL
jgi:hypothetical protein